MNCRQPSIAFHATNRPGRRIDEIGDLAPRKETFEAVGLDCFCHGQTEKILSYAQVFIAEFVHKGRTPTYFFSLGAGEAHSRLNIFSSRQRLLGRSAV